MVDIIITVMNKVFSLSFIVNSASYSLIQQSLPRILKVHWPSLTGEVFPSQLFFIFLEFW